MTIAQTVFSTTAPVLPPTNIVQLRQGSSVRIPIAVVDTLGRAVDCTGATLTAVVIDTYQGSFNATVVLTSVMGGVGYVFLPADLINRLTPQTANALQPYGSVSVAMTDTTGVPFVFDPVGTLTLRRQDPADVVVQPALQSLVIAGVQGPAGPGVTLAQVAALANIFG